jgi:hypothetical protein
MKNPMRLFSTFITMVRTWRQVWKFLAAAGESYSQNATPPERQSSPSMRYGISPPGTEMRDGMIALTFPDGSEVQDLEDLSRWIEMIEEDPDTPEDGKEVAWMLVNSIRARWN